MSFQLYIFLPFFCFLCFVYLMQICSITLHLTLVFTMLLPATLQMNMFSMLHPITLQMELVRVLSTKNSIINMDVQSQSLICQRQQKHWIDLPKDGIVCVKLLIMKLINYYWDFVCSAIIHPHCIYSKKCYRESTISCFNSLSNTRYICFVLREVEELLLNLSPSFYSASYSGRINCMYSKTCSFYIPRDILQDFIPIYT